MRTLVFACLMIVSVSAVKAQFVADTHYVVVSDTKTAEPTVTEFFSLFCGHCFQFEPLLKNFKSSLPEGTHFEKSHVTYLPKGNDIVGEGIVRAFVAMEELGKREELSKAFFTQIHVDQKDINSLDEIKKIFLANGVSEIEFERVFYDDEVIAEAKKMSQLWLDKKIQSVPTMVVNGKYRVNMGSVKNLDELNSLVKHLLEK